MAPVAATVALSHVEGVSDSARARELYKYYQPSSTTAVEQATTHPAPDEDPASNKNLNIQSNIHTSKISSPDTALTAFSQLVAWRTGCQRAMISVIDGATQYFIAESTKTVDLVDNTRHSPGDDLWIGCTEVSKAGRLCEKTIELQPAPQGQYPAFIVSDLSNDERFNQLPFVTGPPYLKYYAGTPLITKRGIPIGSLFVVDDRLGIELSKEQIHFMGTVARTIMVHLEMVREVEEHRRGMKMSRGLASFVEGRSELIEAEIEAEDVDRFDELLNSKGRGSSDHVSRSESLTTSVSSVDRKEREYSSAMLKTEEAIMSSSETVAPDLPTVLAESRPTSFDGGSVGVSSVPTEIFDKIGIPDQTEASSITKVFSRAANLIREAFEVNGGSIFLDAQRGFSSDYEEHNQESPSLEEVSVDPFKTTDDSFKSQSIDFAVPAKQAQFEPSPPSRVGTYSRTSIGSNRIVEVLGFSTPGASSIHGDHYPGPSSYSAFEERTLHGLLRKYPRGKLWTFDEDGTVSSSEDDLQSVIKSKSPSTEQSKLQRQNKRRKYEAEVRLLLKHFPGVRQLLFIPLWDASRSRWLSANFTWSSEATRILSKQNELSFLTAFGNSVMAECSRIDTEIADQKKGDFIGSISHELRSPLHGILASAEFLGEEVTEGFSKGLVETIDSCGRTLLDTINHILDFSKINHFEKDWRRSRRAALGSSRSVQRTGPLALRQSDVPMINLFAEFDISVICEVVVESVFAGHVFQNVTAPSFDMVPDVGGKMADSKRYSSSDSIVGSGNAFHHPAVAVILDIDVRDYLVCSQPGALRRVIMNLLGNALKYTSTGYVRIKLDAEEMEDFHPPSSTEVIPRTRVTLTITDTGKGISSEFIRSKLFTPFAQENSLSSGTGLGLSIVRSIVALLEGEIQIKSEIGRGTEVKVKLPLLRELPSHSSGSTTKSVSSAPKDVDGVIDQLRSKVVGRSACLYGFDTNPEGALEQQREQLLKASISNFLSNWYGLKIVPAGQKTHFIIVNEPDIALVTRLGIPPHGEKRGPVVLALCSHASRFDRAHATPGSNPNIGFLAKPVGPLKLARALSQCLGGIPITSTPGVGQLSSGSGSAITETTDLSENFQELSISPRGGEVLDNSRMAAGSDNARKALESPAPNLHAEKTQEFPFPSDLERSGSPRTNSFHLARDTLALHNVAFSSVTPAHGPGNVNEGKNSVLGGSVEATTSVVLPSQLPSPRLLLVDDNKINLRLLRTYMRKRQYECIDEAEDGLQAVNAVKEHTEAYDIIFMDISMPVLDGFGATRQIRQIELERRERATAENKKSPNPALIIALTGLASSRDQTEAFTSGIDLFLTKPVAFKEVGKMLDNWVANREEEVNEQKNDRQENARNSGND